MLFLPRALDAQSCGDFELITTTTLNGSGIHQVDVYINAPSQFSSNIMRLEFDITGGNINCWSNKSGVAHGFGFDLTITNNNKTIVLERAGSTINIPPNLTYMFRINIDSEPGDCFTLTQDEDGTFNFVNGEPHCHPTNSQIIINDCIDSETISGVVNRPTSLPHCDNSINGGVPNVVITADFTVSSLFCMNDIQNVTGADGFYSFDLNPGLPQEVFATSEATIMCGLSQTDLDIIEQHILGVSVFSEAWQYIAADITRDEEISGADMTKINKLIKGFLDPDDFEGWRFPTSYSYYQVPNPFLGFGFPQVEYEFDPFSGETLLNFDFVGIKMGDLNTSCSDCVNFKDEEIASRSKSEKIEGIVKDGIYSVNLSSDDLRTYFTFEGIYSKEDFIIESNIEIIHDVFDIDGETIVTIFLMNYEQIDKVTLKIKTKNQKLIEAYTRKSNSEENYIDFKEINFVISPNPSADNINFECSLNSSFSIMNVNGENIKTGITNGNINVTDIPSGVYFLHLNANDKQIEQVTKFIKI